MKATLAEQLLLAVLEIEDLQELAEIRERLETLTVLKYDSYEGYSPGVRFMESLATWLSGFQPSDRRNALDFVLSRLTFLSSIEMDHLVSLVYPDILRPWLVRRAADMRGESRWNLRAAAESTEFEALQRRMLIVGMSDGARLDKLRRSGPFSNEQFHPVAAIDKSKASGMVRSLKKVMDERGWVGERKFNSVVVIDDFAGSGLTMLREGDDGWAGRLPKIRDQLEVLKKMDLVSSDACVLAVLYLVTDRAALNLSASMERAGFSSPDYEVKWAHRFPETFPLAAPMDQAFLSLCSEYFNADWQDEHTDTGGDLMFGFGGSALPLVLHHNAPNNAPPIIWKDDSSGRQGFADGWRGVFPRHERHHPGRA